MEIECRPGETFLTSENALTITGEKNVRWCRILHPTHGRENGIVFEVPDHHLMNHLIFLFIQLVQESHAWLVLNSGCRSGNHLKENVLCVWSQVTSSPVNAGVRARNRIRWNDNHDGWLIRGWCSEKEEEEEDEEEGGNIPHVSVIAAFFLVLSGWE